MNQPPSVDATEAVDKDHQSCSSTTLENRPRDVAHRNVDADRDAGRSSSTRTSTSSPTSTDVQDAVSNQGVSLVGAKKELEAAPAIRCPPLTPSQETPSPPSAPVSATGGGSRSSHGSIISKASTILSNKTNEIDGSATETMPLHSPPDAINENDSLASSSSTSSSTSNNKSEINENDDSSSLPAYVTTSVQSTGTVFTPRKKELHYFSDIFRQDYQSWLNDDDEDSDDSDDDDNDNDSDDDGGSFEVSSRGYTEYTGRTNFDERNGSCRLSHEASALSFALTLDLDDFDTDSDEKESVATYVHTLTHALAIE